MSYVKPANAERIEALKEELGIFYGPTARNAEEKERMLAAIEECRWEAGPEWNRAMHTVLDVLQYLVERT
jgi:hypothetical protein